jgi:hemoglobin
MSGGEDSGMGGSEYSLSVYDALGGATPIKVIVDDFYERVVGDEKLACYFVHTDLGRLKVHLRSFITAAGGGPEIYAGRSMSDAHHASHIAPEHFDRVIGHLVDTLTSHAISPAVVSELSAQLSSFKGEVAPARRYSPRGAPVAGGAALKA